MTLLTHPAKKIDQKFINQLYFLEGDWVGSSSRQANLFVGKAPPKGITRRLQF